MADFNVRSESVDVEQIMRQIRARIQQKRGVDYTEAEVQELAKVKLEKFLDPRAVRSDLLDQFRKLRPIAKPADTPGDDARRPKLWGLRRFLDRLVLGEYFRDRIQRDLVIATIDQRFHEREELHFEVIHNLVLEATRLGIEVHNMKMRLESLSSRMDFDERRGRSLESVVQFKPAAIERPADRPNRDRDNRDDRGQRNQRHQRPPMTQQTQPTQTSPAPSMPASTSPMTSPASQPSSSVSQPIVNQTPGQPDVERVAAQPGAERSQTAPATNRAPGHPGADRNGPDGDRRRRRRRRRRRPGQNMADRTGAPGAQTGAPGSTDANAPAGHHDDGGDHGHDDPGSDDGPDGEADGQ